jgi:autotransporter passenger strand-loop-strand repeat protein
VASTSAMEISKTVRNGNQYRGTQNVESGSTAIGLIVNTGGIQNIGPCGTTPGIAVNPG